MRVSPASGFPPAVKAYFAGITTVLCLILFALFPPMVLSQTALVVTPDDVELVGRIEGDRTEFDLLLAFNPFPLEAKDAGQAWLMITAANDDPVNDIRKLYINPAHARSSWMTVQYNRGTKSYDTQRYVRFSGLRRDRNDTLSFKVQLRVELGDSTNMRRYIFHSKPFVVNPFKAPVREQVASRETAPAPVVEAPLPKKERQLTYTKPKPPGALLCDWKWSGDSLRVVFNVKDIHNQFLSADFGVVYVMHNAMLKEIPTVFSKNNDMMVVEVLLPAQLGLYQFLLSVRTRDYAPVTYYFEKKKNRYSPLLIGKILFGLVAIIYLLLVMRFYKRRPAFDVMMENVKLYRDNRDMFLNIKIFSSRPDHFTVRWFMRDDKLAGNQAVYLLRPRADGYQELPYREYIPIRWRDEHSSLSNGTLFSFKREQIKTDFLIRLQPHVFEPKSLVNIEFEWKSPFGTGHQTESIQVVFQDAPDPRPESLERGKRVHILDTSSLTEPVAPAPQPPEPKQSNPATTAGTPAKQVKNSGKKR